MGFLLKSAFWLSLVLLLIPFDDGGGKGNRVTAMQAFIAAGEAASDVAGMCDRKPEVCTVGRSAIETIGARAKVGAGYALKMIDKDGGKRDNTVAQQQVSPGPDASIETGTVGSKD